MSPAQRDEVIELRRTAIGPVSNMMTLASQAIRRADAASIGPTPSRRARLAPTCGCLGIEFAAQRGATVRPGGEGQFVDGLGQLPLVRRRSVLVQPGADAVSDFDEGARVHAVRRSSRSRRRGQDPRCPHAGRRRPPAAGPASLRRSPTASRSRRRRGPSAPGLRRADPQHIAQQHRQIRIAHLGRHVAGGQLGDQFKRQGVLASHGLLMRRHNAQQFLTATLPMSPTRHAPIISK